MTQVEHIAPQAPEFEQAVLGVCLQFPEGRIEALSILRPECFYVAAHKMIFEAILSLDSAGEPVDVITVVQRLRQRGTLDIAGGAVYVSGLINGVSGSKHVEYHSRIIVQQWARREMIQIAGDTARSAYSDEADVFDVMADAETRHLAMAEQITRKPSETIEAVAKEHLESLNHPPVKRHSTGFRDLDKAIGGGWGSDDLIILAGRPAMGKTSAAFSMIYESCKAGHPTALFSLELGKEKMNARFVSIGTGIPIPVLLEGKLTTKQVQQVHEHFPGYSKMPLHCNFATGITIPEIRSQVARLKRRQGITAVYIDQLNWITAPKGEKDRVGAITRGLKHIAMEFQLPVIVLHQLSRGVTGRPDKRPELTDLRESGAAEQDAQLVVFVHRPEYYNITEDENGSTVGRGDLIIAKNSNGPTTSVRVRFDAYCARFRDNDAEGAGAPPTAEEEEIPF